MSNEPLKIISSASCRGDGVAFLADAQTGKVLRVTADIEDIQCIPAVFDLQEYQEHYGGELPRCIDILHIGYRTVTGQYEPAVADARRRQEHAMHRRAVELLRGLCDCAAVYPLGTWRHPPAQAALHNAKQFLKQYGE